MKPIIAIFVLTALLSGCATPPDNRVNDAVADYIGAAELAPLDKIRTRGEFSHKIVSERYVIVTTRRDNYLVEFVRDCRELNQYPVQPDYRHDSDVLHARFDTIRGCHIGKIYAIDEGQAQELENLGEAPGD